LNNLFAIVTTTGDAALIKGGAVKAEHYREKNEIRDMQETRDFLRKHGLEVWKRFRYMYLRAYFKWHERLRHPIQDCYKVHSRVALRQGR